MRELSGEEYRGGKNGCTTIHKKRDMIFILHPPRPHSSMLKYGVLWLDMFVVSDLVNVSISLFNIEVGGSGV